MAVLTEAPVKVLHLLGSSTSTFYYDLSLMYGRTCAAFEGLDKVNFRHEFAVVGCDGRWSFPPALDEQSLQDAEKCGLGAAMAKLEAADPPVDVVMPHMFCQEGMTHYRSMCEMLGLEVLGNSGHTCTLGNDKFITKHVCKAAGVPVPDGEQLRKEIHGVDIPATARRLIKERGAPFIIKPAREDNSIGLSLVKTNSPEEVEAALTKGFQHDNHILVEQYIAGRECRVAVLELEDGEGIRLQILPKIEYLLDDIRTAAHKLATTSDGRLITSSDNPAESITAAKTQGDRICPAQFSPEIDARLNDLAIRAHGALQCKYYSLYDVRISEEGYPFMLEAALFCSFSPLSVIVALAAQSDDEQLKPHPRVFEMLLRRAAKETRQRRAMTPTPHAVGALK